MKRILPLVLLLPTPLLAQQQSVDEASYNFFDVDYVGTNWDTGAGTIDGNGYAGRFSVAVRDHMYLSGEFSAWEFDGIAGSSQTSSFGIGTNWNLKPRWSVFGTAGIRTADIDVGTGNMQADNPFVTGGVRWKISDGFELRLIGDYVDLDPARTGKVSLTVGGDIFLTDVVALSLEANQNEDDTTMYMVGLRFYHGRDTAGLRKRR